MTALDDSATYALDREGMFDHIRPVGREFLEAYRASATLVAPQGATYATGMVLAGVGGSATAGDYFAATCREEATIPIAVFRGSALPNYVDERTFVVICSYSGDTEEALSCYGDAAERGACVLVIARGGELVRRAEADGVARHVIRYEAVSPRATTVHTLAPLLRVGAELRLFTGGEQAVARAGAAHRDLVEGELAPEIPAARNGAKRLAAAIRDRFTIVVGADHLAAAAQRFRNQLAENGKSLGAFESLPEMGHNLIVGLSTGAIHRDAVALVTLESALYDASLRRRFEVVSAQFASAGIPVCRQEIGGASVLEQLLTATAWGDYTSCYLSLLNQLDPTPVPQIDALKAALRLADVQS